MLSLMVYVVPVNVNAKSIDAACRLSTNKPPSLRNEKQKCFYADYEWGYTLVQLCKAYEVPVSAVRHTIKEAFTVGK